LYLVANIGEYVQTDCILIDKSLKHLVTLLSEIVKHGNNTHSQ